jgi:hypothetical protein
VARPAKESRRDPRYRRFRIAAYALYLAVVVGFCGMLIVSVVRSVIAMTPRVTSGGPRVLTVQECVDQASALWQELDTQRQQLSREVPAKTTDEKWSRFRVRWLGRLRETQSLCALDSRARRPLRRAFESLEHLQDLYMTHAVQFAGEIGPTLDEFRSALDAAKQPLGSEPSGGSVPEPSAQAK